MTCPMRCAQVTTTTEGIEGLPKCFGVLDLVRTKHAAQIASPVGAVPAPWPATDSSVNRPPPFNPAAAEAAPPPGQYPPYGSGSTPPYASPSGAMPPYASAGLHASAGAAPPYGQPSPTNAPYAPPYASSAPAPGFAGGQFPPSPHGAQFPPSPHGQPPPYMMTSNPTPYPPGPAGAAPGYAAPYHAPYPPSGPPRGPPPVVHDHIDGIPGSPLDGSKSDYHQVRSQSFQTITDKFQCLEDVQSALRREGLESSNLIIAIDYTKSNTWTGEKTFGGKSLHFLDPRGSTSNPYQSVVRVVGRTLQAFDDDNLIPVFGFGDLSTGDKTCFPFYPDGAPCEGFEGVLKRYNEITPHVTLAGPTNFAPVIRESIKIVERTQAYHILVIIADGQVTSKRDTEKAIVDASKYPLSIIVVGVGDGPWQMMEEFDDGLPARDFDNFQFVSHFDIASRHPGAGFDAAFATAALMEIPEQFRAIKELDLL
eukprot:CAMPEP_0175936506 /NCGR_PEP_ID=MMETSP0108-20121206/21644_1 /TAXON_ID=195067 ORGANISM="Goniomonas pacifica, Strain CCMP1869" /NCGR_SAMPLE_ID=MMETSP0108 /ASSEMBLY_ACC=CAM_ASM_000204 /LENGTH=479 /DNA_ID=CAMNT_0017260585 /DNA_START=61 /DNA_END=1500 /DNA_ORIENTATION=-